MAPKKVKSAASGVQIDMEGQSFELLFKNHPIPMWIYDLETLAFLDVNDAAVKKYGYTRREFLKLTIKDIRPAEDIPQLLESLEGERPALQYSGGWRHQLKNGEIIFVEITSHLFNLKGRKAAFVLVHDVTERKQAEEALHESESRYRDLVENSQDLICTHDLDGNILSVNEADVKLSGYSRKFLLKMNLKNALVQGGQRDVETYLKRIQEKGRARGEMHIRTEKGEVRIWEYDNTLRTDGMEKPIVRGMARDITERKQAEQALHESELVFRQVWESTSDAMAISDSQGIVLAANPAYYRLYGYSPQQVIGESFAIIFPKDAQDAAIEQYKEVFSAAEEGLEFESVVQRADGVMRNVESRISFLTSNGKRTTMLSTIRDITERREAEELQKKTEIYYHSLFEQTHGAVFIIDLEGRFIKTNQRAADLLGYEIEEIKGLTVSEASAEQEQSRTVVQRLLNGEHIPPYERLFRKKDGSSIPVEVHVELIKDGGGNPLYIQSVARDITERKQAEEKLLGSEERYRSISEDMPAMICRFKPDGTLTFINSFYCDYFNLPHDQLLGSNLLGLMTDAEAEFVRSKYLSLDQKTPYITYEYKTYDAAGNETWQRWTDRALFNDQGEVIEYQSIGEDVTERKKAEQQMAESEARLSALIANSGDLIVIIDAEGKITFASPSAERIFGYTPEEAVGKNFVEWLHPDDLPQALESFQYRRQTPGIAPENIKVRGRHKDGTWRHVEALGTNLLDDPSIKGIVLNIRDETDRNRAQVEKDVLYEIMQGMAFSQNLSEFLSLVHYSIERVFPAKNIFVSLYDPATELFEDAYCVDEYDEPFHPSKQEGTLTSYLFRTGIPLLANDEKFKEMMDSGEVKLVGTSSKSWMGVPLKTAGKTIGVMAIQDYETSNLYTEKDLAFLASISGQVASAVERKQAEEKLQESEKRFSSAFENAPIGMALVSTDGQMLKVNQALCELIGYSESELTSLSFQKITHPDDLDTDLEYLQQTLAGTRQTYQMEKRYQHRLGYYVWAALNVSLVKNEKGAPLYFISQIKDINERKLAEDILKQSEKRYRGLFESTPVALWEEDFSQVKRHIDTLQLQGITDLRSYFTEHPETLQELNKQILILDVNQATINMYGAKDKKHLIENSWKPSPGELNHNIEDFIAIAEGRTSNSWEGQDETIDGKPLEISLTWNVVPGNEEDYSKVIVSTSDVTERKLANEILKESEARYRSLFEDSPISLWEDDYSAVKQKLDELKRTGITDFKAYFAEHPEVVAECMSLICILDANQSSVRLFNAKNKEDLLSNSNKLLQSDTINTDELVNIANGMANFEWEGVNRKLTGELMNIKLTWSAAPGHTEDLAKVILSITDITEITKAQEALHKSEALYRQAIEVAGAVPYYESYYGDGKQHIKYEFIGEGIRQITGYGPDEFNAAVWDSLVEEVILVEELAKYSKEEGIQRVRAGEIPLWKSEFRIRDRQGNTRWVFESAVELRDENGAANGSIGMYQDITARKQAEAEIHRQLSELETLYESGLAISRLLTPKEVAQKVIEILDRRMNWHHIAVRQYHPETNSVKLIGFNRPGISAEEADEYIDRLNLAISTPEQGLSGWVTVYGKSLRVPNVKMDERYAETLPGILSGLYVPLKAGEQVIGSISVESEIEDAFTERDQRLLETLAGQAAISIENANLFLMTQKEIIEREQAEVALQKKAEELLQLNNQLEQRVMERTAEIEATRKRLELATDAAGLGIWAWNISDGSVIWDKQMFNIYGLSPQSFDGKVETQLKFIHPEDKTILLGVAKAITENKENNFKIEHRILRRDGTIRTLFEQGVAIFGQSGSIESIIGIANDITPQKQAEQDLHESEAYARLLFDAAPDPVSVSEVDGIMVDVNRLFEQQHQIQRKDVQGRPISELNIFPEEQLKKAGDYIAAIVEGKQVPPVELDFYHPGGGSHTLEMRSYPIEVKGRQLVLSTSRDITLHKKAEESLRVANMEMERALRMKDEFLANMSHELRTPLNAVLGMSESLEEQIAGPLNEKQLKYIGTIRESGKHLLELINDILDLSKIEAGRLELNVSQVSVSSLCEASLRMVKEQAQKKNQNVSLKIDPDVKVIMGDERRLKQSLVNLLSNAVKFTPNDRQVGVEVKGNVRNQTVVFTVWDEGIGMEQEDLDKIFKPFVQLDSGLSREFSGTGLGLVLVAQMIRLHGGSVSVESKEGQGSRFSFTLPWVDVEGSGFGKKMPQETESGSTPEKMRSGKILIVEDTDSIIILLSEYLRFRGYQIIAARNGREGVTLAFKERPDLILMDVMMPIMDGVEATRQIRANKEFQETPIIALTALAMQGDKERCLQAGMTDYLSKPVQMKELENLIHKHIRKAAPPS